MKDIFCNTDTVHVHPFSAARPQGPNRSGAMSCSSLKKNPSLKPRGPLMLGCWRSCAWLAPAGHFHYIRVRSLAPDFPENTEQVPSRDNVCCAQHAKFSKSATASSTKQGQHVIMAGWQLLPTARRLRPALPCGLRWLHQRAALARRQQVKDLQQATCGCEQHWRARTRSCDNNTHSRAQCGTLCRQVPHCTHNAPTSRLFGQQIFISSTLVERPVNQQQ